MRQSYQQNLKGSYRTIGLFNRVQNQGRKIYRRLSNAKHKSSLNNSPRKYAQPNTNTIYIREDNDTHTLDNKVTPSKKPLKSQNLGHNQLDYNTIKIKEKLQNQKNELILKISQMQNLCQQQDHKFSKMRQSYKRRTISIIKQNQQAIKQNVYLKYLCQHYKDKAQKYTLKIKKKQ